MSILYRILHPIPHELLVLIALFGALFSTNVCLVVCLYFQIDFCRNNHILVHFLIFDITTWDKKSGRCKKSSIWAKNLVTAWPGDICPGGSSEFYLAKKSEAKSKRNLLSRPTGRNPPRWVGGTLLSQFLEKLSCQAISLAGPTGRNPPGSVGRGEEIEFCAAEGRPVRREEGTSDLTTARSGGIRPGQSGGTNIWLFWARVVPFLRDI